MMGVYFIHILPPYIYIYTKSCGYVYVLCVTFVSDVFGVCVCVCVCVQVCGSNIVP